MHLLSSVNSLNSAVLLNYGLGCGRCETVTGAIIKTNTQVSTKHYKNISSNKPRHDKTNSLTDMSRNDCSVWGFAKSKIFTVILKGSKDPMCPYIDFKY